MRRKLQVKGYTRTTGGKTTKVKPYSRMGGKEGVYGDAGRGEPGEEYESRKGEELFHNRAEEDYEYKPGEYAYMTEEEWAAMVEKATREREAKRSSAFRKTVAPEKKETPRQPHKYSSLPGVAGRLNQVADKMLAWADKHLK